MPGRIAIGQLLQETNSLNPVPTQRADFEAWGLVAGDAVVGRYGDVGELAGFGALPERLGEPVDWLGLLRAVAWSGGPLAGGLLAELIEGMTAPLHAATVDGVLVSLHGAQAAVDDPDVSGALLQAVRAAVGPDVPIVATLDLHANVTPRLAAAADVLVGYHTFPHVDHVACGRRAAACLARLLRGGARPAVRLAKIPMVVSSEGRNTGTGVQADLWRRIVAAEERPDVDSVGLYPVQPWLDAPWLGWSLYQAWHGAAPPFDDAEIAAQCWATRRHRQIDYVSREGLLAAVRAVPGGPVAVSEGHDATNSGAPGDSTHLLAALVAQDIGDGGGLAFCVDPESVARCLDAGVGARLSLAVGGRRDPFSQPLPVTGMVQGTGHLRYTLSGHGGHNLPVDMGRCARLRVRDTTIVLVERTGPGSSPQLYIAAGADPRAVKVVLAKSPEGFRADYEPFAAGILYAAAPGCATPFVDQVPFTQTHRPLFPLDDLGAPADAPWAGVVHERVARG